MSAESKELEIRLNQLAPGQKAVVRAIDNTPAELKRKLLSMGVVQGSGVEMLHSAPLGDPVAIRTMGYKLSLRKSEARHILVRLLHEVEGSTGEGNDDRAD